MHGWGKGELSVRRLIGPDHISLHLEPQVDRQVVYPLEYRGEYVGAYIADIVVEGTVILELKSVKELTSVMDSQIINYLKLSRLPVGYLLTFFGTRVEWGRFVNQPGG